MGVPHDRSSRPARPPRGAWSRTGGAILDLLDRPIRQWLWVHFLVTTSTIPAPAPPPDAEVPHPGGSTGPPPELRTARRSKATIIAPALGGRLDQLLHDEAPPEVLFPPCWNRLRDTRVATVLVIEDVVLCWKVLRS
jgi:hypothetical protein